MGEQSSQNISDMKINIFRKKNQQKEKWAIQTSKFKQETALNKKTNLTLSGELTFVNSDCNTSSAEPFGSCHLTKSYERAYYSKNLYEFTEVRRYFSTKNPKQNKTTNQPTKKPTKK